MPLVATGRGVQHDNTILSSGFFSKLRHFHSLKFVTVNSDSKFHFINVALMIFRTHKHLERIHEEQNLQEKLEMKGLEPSDLQLLLNEGPSPRFCPEPVLLSASSRFYTTCPTKNPFIFQVLHHFLKPFCVLKVLLICGSKRFHEGFSNPVLGGTSVPQEPSWNLFDPQMNHMKVLIGPVHRGFHVEPL